MKWFWEGVSCAGIKTSAARPTVPGIGRRKALLSNLCTCGSLYAAGGWAVEQLVCDEFEGPWFAVYVALMLEQVEAHCSAAENFFERFLVFLELSCRFGFEFRVRGFFKRFRFFGVFKVQ